MRSAHTSSHCRNPLTHGEAALINPMSDKVRSGTCIHCCAKYWRATHEYNVVVARHVISRHDNLQMLQYCGLSDDDGSQYHWRQMPCFRLCCAVLRETEIADTPAQCRDKPRLQPEVSPTPRDTLGFEDTAATFLSAQDTMFGLGGETAE